MAAESGKIDPMHQFLIEPLFGRDWTIAGQSIAFTNSALWMLIALGVLWLFMLGGMKRELVPGRWQVAVEGFTGFITTMMDANIGPEGTQVTSPMSSRCSCSSCSPIARHDAGRRWSGVHPFTVTSQFTVTGVLAIISFSIVLIVGFWQARPPFLLAVRAARHVDGPMVAADLPDRVHLAS